MFGDEKDGKIKYWHELEEMGVQHPVVVSVPLMRFVMEKGDHVLDKTVTRDWNRILKKMGACTDVMCMTKDKRDKVIQDLQNIGG